MACPRRPIRLLPWAAAFALVILGSHASANSWNQWLGNPGRTLMAPGPASKEGSPTFTRLWNRPLGSGFAGISIHASNAITAMATGGQDVAVLFDIPSGNPRWQYPLGRTRKRSEGAPPGPLSTPALDAESVYVQALDGRVVCLDVGSGTVRWETQCKRAFRAYEPGYGFASSPLLLEDLVVLLPAGSTTASAVALDRRTGDVRWKTALGSAAEYASPTAWRDSTGKDHILAHLKDRIAAVSAADGHVHWSLPDVPGGLWTPSILSKGRAFLPTAGQSRVLELPGVAAEPPRTLWTSPVFESVMGPVVEISGLLVGHHDRRLTAVDMATGKQAWQLPDESDGQLLVLGSWLVFFHDRAGRLEVLRVRPDGIDSVWKESICPPFRMETPLTFADSILHLRTQDAWIAMKASWPSLSRN